MTVLLLAGFAATDKFSISHGKSSRIGSVAGMKLGDTAKAHSSETDTMSGLNKHQCQFWSTSHDGERGDTITHS